MDKSVIWFSEIRKEDVKMVGGKGANLGELASFAMPVPPGFVIGSSAYFHFLTNGALAAKISQELKNLSVEESEALLKASQKIKTAILAARVPPEIEKDIIEAYHRLSGIHDAFVAIRSSATAEDLAEASFAGQQESYLNVAGAGEVVAAVQKCWASLFEPRAIFYRQEKGFGHVKVALAVVVQRMVESETSGIMFTIDPLTNDPEKIAIEAAFGLGQPIVSGEITPDQYLLDKKSLKILKKQVVRQTWQLIKAGPVRISKEFQTHQKLPEAKIKELARLGLKIEEHYGSAQDIEWAFQNHKLFIVQARPVTTVKDQISKIKDQNEEALQVEAGDLNEKLLLTGIGASQGIASGPVIKIKSAQEIMRVKAGDVLVAKMTSPDYVPAMKKASAIVTDEGGRTSHAAIVSRELEIPCVVGTGQAMKMLKEGEYVTVDGGQGRIYEGLIESGKLKVESENPKLSILNSQLSTKIKTATKVYVNLADPETALNIASQNVDGVGLLRAEFIMAEIGEHPRAILAQGRQKEYVGKLAGQIGKVAKAFSPRPVVYRTSDFRTNEYRNLAGGSKFEPHEENPMLGFRGALRYVTEPEVFEMEIKAILWVRNKMHLRNLWVMIPFVRTVSEFREVKKIMAANGLKRSASFKLWLMVEVPANAILLEEFIGEGLDGVSIGSNDLTMLTLGADRDNRRLKDYTEENEAVVEILEQVIKTAKRLGISASICGEAPSVYPQLLKKLIRFGISSVSVDPDVIEVVRQAIVREEQELVFGP